MSENDPFSAFESDRTIIKPSPGGRPQRPPANGSPSPAAASANVDLPPLDSLGGGTLNPLVAAAMPLLGLVPQIRAMAQHPNPAALKESLTQGIRRFEEQAHRQGQPNEQVIAGRYILCTLLDEVAANTPWGGQGAWGKQSLLVSFHNEAWGGEKVFQLLAKLAENPAANLNLLELIYAALALGFEGRYRVLDNGRAQLDTVRERLAQMVRQQRGAYDKELSPHWRGVDTTGRKLAHRIPLWVIVAGGAAILGVVFVGLRLALNAASDPVFDTILGIRAKAPAVAVPLAPAPKPRLAAFLQPEIAAGLVAVRDEADRSVVTIRGDGFFEAGSAVVAESVRPLLKRIAAALNSVPGQVLITGHTDNQPIRSPRFPSNWHLSQERANAVSGLLLAEGIRADRLRAEGRADSEPVADNGGREGRSKNRRVEVTLFVRSGN